MLLALLVWAITAGTVVLFIGKYWWFPPPINAHGRAYDSHFTLTLVITGLIFFLAQLALGWVIAKYKDDGGRAQYTHGNNKLEALWTGAAAVLFIGLVVMGSRIWANVHFTGAPPNAMPIEVMAKQFAWSFRYPGPDGKFGHTDLKLVNDAAGNPFGIDESDPAAKDDITSSAIRVPVGRPILLSLHARDVIHSFFVRELRLKQDLVPGMEIPLHFQADQVGTYEVACAELCGLGHHQMRSTLLVMSEADFQKWQQEQLAQK